MALARSSQVSPTHPLGRQAFLNWRPVTAVCLDLSWLKRCLPRRVWALSWLKKGCGCQNLNNLKQIRQLHKFTKQIWACYCAINALKDGVKGSTYQEKCDGLIFGLPMKLAGKLFLFGQTQYQVGERRGVIIKQVKNLRLLSLTQKLILAPGETISSKAFSVSVEGPKNTPSVQLHMLTSTKGLYSNWFSKFGKNEREQTKASKKNFMKIALLQSLCCDKEMEHKAVIKRWNFQVLIILIAWASPLSRVPLLQHPLKFSILKIMYLFFLTKCLELQ